MAIRLILLAVVLGLVRGQSHCPSGWQNYRTSCYKFIENPLTWDKAKDFCHDNSEYNYGHLASVHDTLENDFITYVVMKGQKKRAWIGLNDQKTEGEFEWDAHNREVFLPEQTFWKRGEPNNFMDNENCVEINRGGLGRWNDCKCRKSLPFICELELFTLSKGGRGNKAGLPKADPRFPHA
ncbi:C-type lectin lectoxin-Phi1-like [Apostichopus japonicus]|uniref:C-type lectin lectoxin-Phi1-like n=1 Tax=Stichopus japonicus TaxID=307972 RepID=UPI003AB6A259